MTTPGEAVVRLREPVSIALAEIGVEPRREAASGRELAPRWESFSAPSGYRHKQNVRAGCGLSETHQLAVRALAWCRAPRAAQGGGGQYRRHGGLHPRRRDRGGETTGIENRRSHGRNRGLPVSAASTATGSSRCGAAKWVRATCRAGDRRGARRRDSARAAGAPLLPHTHHRRDQEGVHDPVGMAGVRLEARIVVVDRRASYAQNLVKCCEQGRG